MRKVNETVAVWQRGDRVTRTKLVKAGACGSGVQTFSRAFPRGMVLNRKNLVTALARGVNLVWLTDALNKPCACKFKSTAVDHNAFALAVLLAHYGLSEE